MGVNQLVGRGAKAGGGMGKNLQGMNQVIFMTPKYNHYVIGHQFDNYKRKGCSEKHSRQVNFRWQKRRDKPFSRPPLYLMFQSSGYLAPSPFVESKDTVTVLV